MVRTFTRNWKWAIEFIQTKDGHFPIVCYPSGQFITARKILKGIS
jgi:hypothetical protein